MNDTTRNRLIGLAVILVILFLLSWLIPQQPRTPGGESIPVAAVPVGSSSTVVAPVATAPDVTPVGEATHASSGDDGIRTQPYDTGNNAAATAQRQPPAAAEKQGAPADVSPAPSQGAATSAVVKHDNAPEKTQATGAGAAFVQIGSYSDSSNAQSVLSELRKKGYRAEVDQVTVAGKSYHRVRVGPYKDRDAASTAQKKLAADGYKGSAVVGGS